MNFKLIPALAAAAILAGLGFLSDAATAGGPGHGSGGSHGFRGGHGFGGGGRFGGGGHGFAGGRGLSSPGPRMGLKSSPNFRASPNRYLGYNNRVAPRHLYGKSGVHYGQSGLRRFDPKGYPYRTLGQSKGLAGFQKNGLPGKHAKPNWGKPQAAGLAGLQKGGFAGKPLKPNWKNPQFRNAAFTKENLFSGQKFGAKHWDHNHHHHHDHARGWHRYRWYGPVFWPYYFGDYFCYGLWPGYCSDVYWGYGPNVIVWGAFWPYDEFYADGASIEDSVYEGEVYAPYRKRAANAKPETADVAETCKGFAPGVSDLPVDKLQGIVDATEEQRAALEELKAAAANASDALRKACPAEPALTPLGRLDAMERRLQAMEEANNIVRAPFVRLYNLLSDAQKQRLEAVSKPAGKQPQRGAGVNVAQLCTSQAGFANVPMEQITGAVTLTPEQQQKLESLKSASEKASEGLKSSCPASVPETLDGRLDAAQQRVAALIGAIGTVRPAVSDFYASLTDEQKAALSVQRTAENRG